MIFCFPTEFVGVAPVYVAKGVCIIMKRLINHDIPSANNWLIITTMSVVQHLSIVKRIALGLEYWKNISPSH